jgi:hypothetical protein
MVRSNVSDFLISETVKGVGVEGLEFRVEG